MSKPSQQVMGDLQAIKPLPDGYSMECWDGDNIIVKGSSCGFAITRACIEDNIHIIQYPRMLDRLIEVEEMGGSLYLDELPNKLVKILGEP